MENESSANLLTLTWSSFRRIQGPIISLAGLVLTILSWLLIDLLRETFEALKSTDPDRVSDELSRIRVKPFASRGLLSMLYSEDSRLEVADVMSDYERNQE